jgi:hypothetical protein
MIHALKIDDNSPTGKRIIDELRKHSKVKQDFWKTLPEDQKQEIEKGLSEIIREETVEYESVLKKHRK